MYEIDKIDILAPFKKDELDSLPMDAVINQLNVTKRRIGTGSFLFTTEAARRLAQTAGIKSLWLWCDVSRAALKDIARIPNLQRLDVLEIRGPGYVCGLEQASELKIVRVAIGCSARDAQGLLNAKGLCELSLQSSHISEKLVAGIAALPQLRILDLEGSDFDDTMAATLATSKSIENFSAGASRLTRKGLRHLCKMKQLKDLDLWACRLSVGDLTELEALPNLEYLSFGSTRQPSPIDSEALIAGLDRLSALKRIWLDGVDMSPAQIASLNKRYEKARIDASG